MIPLSRYTYVVFHVIGYKLFSNALGLTITNIVIHLVAGEPNSQISAKRSCNYFQCMLIDHIFKVVLYCVHLDNFRSRNSERLWCHKKRDMTVFVRLTLSLWSHSDWSMFPFSFGAKVRNGPRSIWKIMPNFSIHRACWWPSIESSHTRGMYLTCFQQILIPICSCWQS